MVLRLGQAVPRESLCRTPRARLSPVNDRTVPFADGDTVERLLDYPSLIEWIRAAFIDPPTTPERLAIPVVETEDQPGGMCSSCLRSDLLDCSESRSSLFSRSSATGQGALHGRSTSLSMQRAVN